MKKLSYKFQEGNFWTKLFYIVSITILLIVTWLVIDSIMFFLQTTVGTIGLLVASPFIAMGVVAFSILKHPKVRDRDSYSDFVKKYL